VLLMTTNILCVSESNTMSDEEDPTRPGYNPNIFGTQYKFLGPGNPIDTEVPVNALDQLAKEHDIAYANARTQEEIREADDKFIEEAEKIGWPTARASAAAMRVKRGTETLAGPLYGLTGFDLLREQAYHKAHAAAVATKWLALGMGAAGVLEALRLIAENAIERQGGGKLRRFNRVRTPQEAAAEEAARQAREDLALVQAHMRVGAEIYPRSRRRRRQRELERNFMDQMNRDGDFANRMLAQYGGNAWVDRSPDGTVSYYDARGLNFMDPNMPRGRFRPDVIDLSNVGDPDEDFDPMNPNDF